MSYVLFEWAVVAESVVASGREFAESAVKAGWGAVTLNSSMQAFAVAEVVVGFGMSTITADTTPFIIRGPGACVGIVG